MFTDFFFDFEPETLALQSALDNLLQGNCDGEQTEQDELFFSVVDPALYS